MKIFSITTLILILSVSLFGQEKESDWSDTSVNFPITKEDTASIAYPDSGEVFQSLWLRKILRVQRVIQDKVGVGSDTAATAREVFIFDGDSTIWRLLVDADIPDGLTAINYVLLTAVGDTVRVYISDLPPDSLAQAGASTGQILKWNGSIWAPANDNTGAGGSAYADSVVHDGRNVIGDSLITDDEGDARFEPIDAAITKSDEAETITANWVNTANPWADNEMADNLTASNYLLLSAYIDSINAYMTDSVGVQLQAWDTDLDTWATVTPSANGQSFVEAANYAAMRALLDLEAGTDFYSISAADNQFGLKVKQDFMLADTTGWNSAYAHISNNGSDHSYIDQSVVSGATPTFTGTNLTGIPGSGLTDNSILEPKLNATNSPIDNYLLSYNLAGTNFTWVISPSVSSDSNFVKTITDTTETDVLKAKTGNKITLEDTLEIGQNGGITGFDVIVKVDTIDTRIIHVDSIIIDDDAELPTGAIDAEGEISNDMLNSQHYVAASIDNEHLADDAADSDEIASGAIDLDHMSVESIDSDQYVDASIDAAHLAAGIIIADTLVIPLARLVDSVKVEEIPGWKIPYDITVIKVSAYTDANTTTFNIEERVTNTPNTAGTNMFSSDMVAVAASLDSTSFTNATFAKDTWMVLDISATGDVEIFSVMVRYVKD